MHNMVDHSGIKSIAQHDMLIYYGDCALDCVTWKCCTMEFF
jgi:hypothetical protein